MAKRPVAAVLGDINRDLIVRVRHFPRPGGDHPADGSAWALGGSAANTAVALARLGVPARVIGRIGSDPEGRALLKELSRLGVHAGAVQKDPSRATGICIVTVTADGERRSSGLAELIVLCSRTASPRRSRTSYTFTFRATH